MNSSLPRLTLLAVASALLLTGCSSSDGSDSAPAATGTGITNIDHLQNELHCEELQAELEQLSLDLNAAAAPGLSEINMYCYRAEDTVGIDLLTADDPGLVTADQLQSVLDVLAMYQPSATIGSYTINAWDMNYMQGELNHAAREIGVRSDFIDNDWDAVIVPADQLANLFE